MDNKYNIFCFDWLKANLIIVGIAFLACIPGYRILAGALAALNCYLSHEYEESKKKA